jgi:hypothetical protein
MTHTPAPWTLNPARSTRVDLIDNSKGEAIGEIVWVDVRKPADARLIAAAPEMLNTLEWFMEQMHDDTAIDMCKLLNELERKALHAIQQAKGAAA